MNVMFSSGELIQKGGRVHLIHRNGDWHVVGPGYLCSVSGPEEGAAVMADLQAQGRTRGVAIKATLGCGSDHLGERDKDVA